MCGANWAKALVADVMPKKFSRIVKEKRMMRLGLDRMQVKAVFRRTLSGRLDEKDVDLMDYLANTVGEVIEENNKKLCEQLEQYLKRR